MMTFILIAGMSCDHCVAAVRKALEGVSGLTVHAVEIGFAKVMADDDQLIEACEAIEAQGFTVLKGDA